MTLPRLNRRLMLETPVPQADGAGGYATRWVALGMLWAEVMPESGREVRRGETEVSRVRLRIAVRAAPIGSDARPRAGQRFVEGARRFTVVAVTERDAAGAYLTCHAEEETVA